MENIDEHTPDLELARLAREGDESAFEEIVRRYSPRVFSVASRFFRQRSQVEESAQEIFLRAYTRLGDFEGRGSFEGWLTRIATTTCLNLLRHNQRRPESTISDLTDDESEWLENTLAFEMAEKQPTIEDALIAADLADKILNQVSADDRLVLTMIDGAGATIKEVAEMTGWSESKVKVQTFRARRRMRDAVGKLITKKR
jgi:RNA polymerase sigma-70 factor (ECF subfamily)